MILINVKFPIRPDKADEWAALAADYAAAVNAEDGCLYFEFARSVDDPDTWICVEGFRDADAGGAHVQTEAFRRFVDTAPDLVREQPQIIYIDSPETAGWGPMGEITPR